MRQWAAMQGRRQLKVQWDDGPHAKFESESYKKELLSTVAALKPGVQAPLGVLRKDKKTEIMVVPGTRQRPKVRR